MGSVISLSKRAYVVSWLLKFRILLLIGLRLKLLLLLWLLQW